MRKTGKPSPEYCGNWFSRMLVRTRQCHSTKPISEYNGQPGVVMSVIRWICWLMSAEGPLGGWSFYHLWWRILIAAVLRLTTVPLTWYNWKINPFILVFESHDSFWFPPTMHFMLYCFNPQNPIHPPGAMTDEIINCLHFVCPYSI
jgi:hypothetical protein